MNAHDRQARHDIEGLAMAVIKVCEAIKALEARIAQLEAKQDKP